MSEDGRKRDPAPGAAGASRYRGAVLLVIALALVLLLGQASANLIASIWLEPRCEAYAAAHGVDFDGVLLRPFKKRKIAARLSPCLFSDRTPLKSEVPVRWRELGDISFPTRLGVEPAIMSLAIGAFALAAWLTLSPSGVAYRRRASGRKESQ
jgi:anti-sigma factor RsiW